MSTKLLIFILAAFIVWPILIQMLSMCSVKRFEKWLICPHIPPTYSPLTPHSYPHRIFGHEDQGERRWWNCGRISERNFTGCCSALGCLCCGEASTARLSKGGNATRWIERKIGSMFKSKVFQRHLLLASY